MPFYTEEEYLYFKEELEEIRLFLDSVVEQDGNSEDYNYYYADMHCTLEFLKEVLQRKFNFNERQ